MNNPSQNSLDRMLNPKVVAFIGASSNPNRIGGRPLASMLASSFSGRLYPVNPKGGEIQGQTAFTSIAEIPERIDLAVCSIEARHIPATLRDCGEKGAAGAVIFASGFAETGNEGEKLQNDIRDIAAHYGMRLLGPNSLGYVNYQDGIVASFHSAFIPPLIKNGRVGIVSQSGAFLGLVATMANERQLGFSHLFATGNESDLQIADLIAFLAHDPDTDIILCYMETCRDGERLKSALTLAREQGKKIVVVKAGRTEAGARAAQSHTAAMVGKDAIYDALFRQYGVFRAETIDEFFEIGFAATLSPRPRNKNTCIISISGGVGILMADEAASSGLNLPELPAAAAAHMKKLIPYAGVGNPLDVTGAAANDPSLFRKAIECVLETGLYSTLVVNYGAYLHTDEQAAYHFKIWREIRGQYPDMTFIITGMLTPKTVRVFQGMRLLSYREPVFAMRMVANLHDLRGAQEKTVRKLPNPARIDETMPNCPLGEPEILDWFAANGVSVVPHALAKDADEAAAIAASFMSPVAIKLVAKGIIHKSDVKGVHLNVSGEAAVRNAFTEITANSARLAPEAELRGCLIAPMAIPGTETIVGMLRDPVFGPVIMFGLGGIHAEVLKDTVLCIAPFGPDVARNMIRGIQSAAILDGVRGVPPGDIDALAETLVRLSHLAVHCDSRIRSFEINPLRVAAAGEGVLALDAVMEVD